jgi:hypothetical protein
MNPDRGGELMNEKDFVETAARYRRFAEREARGRSPLYEKFASCIAHDRELLRFLLELPRERRQPNLLLVAVRHLFGTPRDWSQFRQLLTNEWAAVRAIMLERSTQTNEPARCAALLPLLVRLPQPLALLEVGASAGLCLLPDLYAHDYGKGILWPKRTDCQVPLFHCNVNDETPLPTSMPDIVWRAGLDLNPLDVSDPAQAGWLEALVWPEQAVRLANLRAAIKIAAAFKPSVVRGDLRHDLAPLVHEAPKEATLVIFHTAVLAYLRSVKHRYDFARKVSTLCPYWVSNEAPQILPDIAQRTVGSGAKESFLLSANGIPVAWTDPHGATLEWIADVASLPCQWQSSVQRGHDCNYGNKLKVPRRFRPHFTSIWRAYKGS